MIPYGIHMNMHALSSSAWDPTQINVSDLWDVAAAPLCPDFLSVPSLAFIFGCSKDLYNIQMFCMENSVMLPPCRSLRQPISTRYLQSLGHFHLTMYLDGYDQLASLRAHNQDLNISAGFLHLVHTYHICMHLVSLRRWAQSFAHSHALNVSIRLPLIRLILINIGLQKAWEQCIAT